VAGRTALRKGKKEKPQTGHAGIVGSNKITKAGKGDITVTLIVFIGC
jgi:hypothetical protein